MSIHKTDIESLLEAFTAVHSKGNMKASGELIPHLVRALVRYVEDVRGEATCCGQADPCCEGSLSPSDRAFAEAAMTKHLKEHGNTTIETDVGSLTMTIDKGLTEAAGIDVEAEVAKAIVTEAVREGATDVTAVTATVEGTSTETEKPVAKKAAVKK